METLEANYSTLQLFSKIGLEQPIKEIISKLLFISKINVGEKLNVRDYFVRDNNLMTQRLIRTVKNWISQDSGEFKADTLKFLEETIKEALELIFIYYPKTVELDEYQAHNQKTRNETNEFNKSIATLLIQNVNECKKGIENLKQTYSYDRNFGSELQALIQTLDVKLNSITKSN